jgi:AcrR family transcriptional regulator
VAEGVTLAVAELPAAPRQARSIAKRRKLLDAARALFGEKGYEATSIGEITARAGTAAGAFYIYFRSKRQLLLILMNELLVRLASTDLTPKGNLKIFLGEVLRADRESLGVIRAWQEAALTDAELGAMQAEITRWTERRILNVLKRLATREDVDLEAFARMMDRHFWALLARAGSLSKRAFDREVALAADVMERYLTSSPGAASAARSARSSRT